MTLPKDISSTYGFWLDLALFLKQKPTDDKILWKIHDIIDQKRGYHYQWIADCNERGLRQLVKDLDSI